MILCQEATKQDHKEKEKKQEEEKDHASKNDWQPGKTGIIMKHRKRFEI